MQNFRPSAWFFYSLLSLLALAGWTWGASSAHAQGFGVYEQGTCVMSRGGAAVAKGCGDGSSIYLNPAHVVEIETETVTGTFGLTVIDAGGEFAYDYAASSPYTGAEVDLQNDPISVPHLYMAYGLTERIGLGLGLYVPYGLETKWPTKLSDGSYFDGAFEGFDNRVQAVYAQPTFAYQLTPKLRVGAGPILAISTVELKQLLDLSQQTAVSGGPTFAQLGVPFHTAFARSKLEGSDELGFGANVGISFQATNRLSLGARFTTPITVSYKGDAEFSQIQTRLTVPADITQDGEVTIPAGTRIDNLLRPQFSSGKLTSQTVETEITFPLQLVGGVSFQATENLLLLADYQFTGWSAFDEIPLEFEKLDNRVRQENYNDTHTVRAGAQYDVVEQLAARIGYIYNTPAAPDEVVTPLLPESDRNQITLGLGWRSSEGTFELNVSYQLLLQNDRRGRVRGALPGEALSTDLNQGLYSFNANLFGATFTLRL